MHLSPYEPLETAGVIVEECFADKVLANSPETRDALVKQGVNQTKIEIFYNAAPNLFLPLSRSKPKIENILFISNHLPEELMVAMKLLERNRNINSNHIGRMGVQRRVTSKDFEACDAIVTIGKSVQYAIASLRPVYMTDLAVPAGSQPPILKERNISTFQVDVAQRS